MSKLVTLENIFGHRVAERFRNLQDLYDSIYLLGDDSKRGSVARLLSCIGAVDAESEGYRSTENQRDLSIKFHWGHNHRFFDDVSVSGRMGSRHISLLAEFVEAFDLEEGFFSGQKVLDIGCWTGGTTLSLNMMGAASVHALEEVRKYSQAANDLFSIYGLNNLDCEARSLFDLAPANYDIVYFPGVVYHLSDPVLGLRRLFLALRDGGWILVETAGFEGDQPVARFEGSKVFHGDLTEGAFNRGGWNWFIPSSTCLGLWMEVAGFEDVRVFYSKRSKRLFAIGRRQQYHDITRAGLSVPDID